MPIKKVKKFPDPPVVVEEKKEKREYVKRIKKIEVVKKPEIIVEEKKPEPIIEEKKPEPEIIRVETLKEKKKRITQGRNKTPWDGIGLIGTAEEIKVFRTKVREKGLILGRVILEFLQDFNSKN